MKEKKECRIRMDFDLDKFRDLSDEEIVKRFNKAVLPAVIKKLRQGGVGKAKDCPVCTPWTYAFH